MNRSVTLLFFFTLCFSWILFNQDCLSYIFRNFFIICCIFWWKLLKLLKISIYWLDVLINIFACRQLRFHLFLKDFFQFSFCLSLLSVLFLICFCSIIESLNFIFKLSNIFSNLFVFFNYLNLIDLNSTILTIRVSKIDL